MGTPCNYFGQIMYKSMCRQNTLSPLIQYHWLTRQLPAKLAHDIDLMEVGALSQTGPIHDLALFCLDMIKC